MNIHIQLDKFGRGIVFWIADDQTGSGAYLPAHDPYRLNEINGEVESRLLRILEITSEENWTAYAISAEAFATAITKCFTELSTDFAKIFDVSPSFRIPEPLRQALENDNEIILVDEWIEAYPLAQ